MTVLVIGRSGQVAQELQSAAKRRGIPLTALGREVADLENPATLEAALDGVPSVSVVVNAAAYTAVDAAETDQERAFAINAEGPAHLAALTAERGLPLVHLSTDYVFDGRKSGPYIERDPVAPRSVYGASKLAGEEAVAAGNPRHIVLRTAWVYSAHGKNFAKTMLRLGAERPELRVVDDQKGSPTSARDLADCVLTAAESASLAARTVAPVWGIYHCAGAGETTWCGFARAIFEEAGSWAGRPLVRAIPSSEFPTPAERPRNSTLDSGHFEARFGTRPRPWPEALRDVLAELAPVSEDLKEAVQ